MKTLIQYINESTNTPTNIRELAKIIKDECSKNGWECNLNHIDVSKMTRLDNLFTMINGLSEFNGDISKWNVSNVTNMSGMFAGSKFNGDISQWDVSKVDDMARMFANSKFEGDINNWDVANVEDMRYMFDNCPLEGKEPKWYKK
jgi:surface protein